MAGRGSRVLGAARRIGHDWRLLLVAAFCAGAAGNALISLVVGPRLPVMHDEFAYLLQGEMIASGRLAYPTHPLWQHFETFHVNHVPTYSAKYPPGFGVLLAVGHLLGQPSVGLWLGSGLLAVALMLALLAWLPRHWAVVIGMVLIPQLAWVSYWARTYFGAGALVAAAAGLCLAQTGPRWKRRGSRSRPAIIVAVGAAVLAITRPYEGVLFVGSLGLWELVERVRGRPSVLDGGRRAVAGALLIVACAAGWMVYVNWRVTGSPMTMPYQVHQAQYAATPSLVLGVGGELPQYRHPEMERYWREWGLERHEATRDRMLDPGWQLSRALALLTFMVGPGLAGMVGLGLSRGAELRRLAGPAVTSGVVLVGTLLTKGAYAHYAAPMAASMAVLVGGGLMRVRRWARARRLWDPTVLVLTLWAGFVAWGGVTILGEGPHPASLERTRTVEGLLRSEGTDLVLVSYGPGHNVHQEWVYNGADIDAAPIVWARSMGWPGDRELLEYYSERKVWCLHLDGEAELRAARVSNGPPCIR